MQELEQHIFESQNILGFNRIIQGKGLLIEDLGSEALGFYV